MQETITTIIVLVTACYAAYKLVKLLVPKNAEADAAGGCASGGCSGCSFKEDCSSNS